MSDEWERGHIPDTTSLMEIPTRPSSWDDRFGSWQHQIEEAIQIRHFLGKFWYSPKQGRVVYDILPTIDGMGYKDYWSTAIDDAVIREATWVSSDISLDVAIEHARQIKAIAFWLSYQMTLPPSFMEELRAFVEAFPEIKSTKDFFEAHTQWGGIRYKIQHKEY